MSIDFIPLNKRWPKKLTKELVSHLTHLLPPEPTAQQLASWIALHGVLDSESPEQILTVTLPKLTDDGHNVEIMCSDVTESSCNLCITTSDSPTYDISKDQALRLYKLLSFYLAKQS